MRRRLGVPLRAPASFALAKSLPARTIDRSARSKKISSSDYAAAAADGSFLSQPMFRQQRATARTPKRNRCIL
jgi:hypothetical protein